MVDSYKIPFYAPSLYASCVHLVDGLKDSMLPPEPYVHKDRHWVYDIFENVRGSHPA
jgi:hypothetical protein